ncbi:MAG: LpqB family beta-propeller domain-containing protein, partial [Bacteroidota bacterium]
MRTTLLYLLALFTTTITAQELYFPDDPALTPDGQTIIFAYGGDLWQVPAQGGAANRITAMDGAESAPKVSPDGKWLAFTSAQYGNNDVYLMPLAGGAITQLTFHEANDEVANWSWDSEEIYFTSNRYNRGTTFTVKRSGGTPVRLFGHYHNTIHNPAPHPRTRRLFFNESWESSTFTHRKGYKGPFNPEIKSFDLEGGTMQVHTDWEGKDMWTMIDRAGNVYFASDRDSREYNLYQLGEGDKVKRLTKFKSAVFAPSIAADGSAIAFIKDYQLQVYDVKSGRTRTVPVSLNAFAGLAKTQDFSTDGNVSYFDVARDGKKIAFVSRGELFVSDIEGKFIRQVPTGEDRVMEVKWMKDDKTLLFTQTHGGYQNLFTVPADGSADPTRRTNDQRNNRMLEISNDTSRVAYLSGRDEIRIMDLDDFAIITAAERDVWFRGSIPRWSPDDRYLLFTGYVGFETDLFISDLENGNQVTNLTRTGVTESSPVWTPDGKYIIFNSARHQPSYPRGGGDMNLYRMALRKYDRPYKDAKVDELFAEENKDKEKKDSVVVQIDFDGLMERLERVGPAFGVQAGAVAFADGDKTVVLYGSSHDEGRFKLFKTVYEEFESPKTEAVAATGVGGATDLIVVKKKPYLIGGRKILAVNLGQNKTKAIELKHTFRRSLAPEFNQMFYETWANLEENFYAEDFHGVDWPALREKYAAYLPHVGTRADLRRLINDMLGELNTSHFGFYSNGKEEATKSRVRSLALGLEFEDAEDPYKITSIVPNGPADREDVDLQVGDRLVAIDNERFAASTNREAYLSRPSVDGEVALTRVRGEEKKVRLHPTSYFTTRNNRYDAWVDACQKRVDDASDKRVAYVHMKNMGGGELNNFLNEMVAEGHRRDALILDLRWNTGGNVHDAVLEYLSRKPYLQWKYRSSDYAPQPHFAPQAKPIILLINQQSLSDAEMTAAGFQELGLGTIMGTPTYRWIIFTSGKGL